MSTIVSQITSLMFVYSTVYSDTDQRKHQSSAPLALVRGIHREPANSPHKWPVTRKMFPFDDVIMRYWPSGKVTLILTLVQAMSGCHHATIHYLSQWWLGFVSLFPGRSELMASQWLHTTHQWINGWRYQDKHAYSMTINLIWFDLIWFEIRFRFWLITLGYSGFRQLYTKNTQQQ